MKMQSARARPPAWGIWCLLFSSGLFPALVRAQNLGDPVIIEYYVRLTFRAIFVDGFESGNTSAWSF